MDLKSIEFGWVETPHDWNAFGASTTTPNLEDAPLHATALVTWKKVTLFDFVGRVATTVFGVKRFTEEQSLLTGAILAFSVVNLMPLNIKIVMDDAYAAQFLSLVKETEDGEQFFLRSDLAKFPQLEPLIEYYLDKNVFAERDRKLIVRGKVLNRARLWS